MACITKNKKSSGCINPKNEDNNNEKQKTVAISNVQRPENRRSNFTDERKKFTVKRKMYAFFC